MLSNEELIAIIEHHRSQSLGDVNTTLASERAEAMDHYHGRPYGDEEDGRSQVVSRDLAETIDWIMPTIMRTFLQSGNIAEFMGTGAEDEAGAAQETDYVNHVIMKDNNGFLMLHDWAKDTLLLKTGYVKHWWDESKKVTEEDYENIDPLSLTKMVLDLENEGAEVEIIENEVSEGGMLDITLKITRVTSRCRIEPVPPEEIRVSKRARYGTQDSQFIEHFTVKTRSELIEMGMDADFVDMLPSKNGNENNQEEIARNSLIDETYQGGSSVDRSVEEVEYSEAYLMVDFDQDGVAELRKVISVANQIPDGDEWNEVVDCVGITSMVSKRIPHRHVGESLDDDLADLQQIKTILTRQLLDNIYATNNQQWIVNKRVHLPDMLQSFPGGIKRVNDDQPVTGAVEAVQTTPILNQILPAIDYVDSVKEGRTGINKTTTGLDPDVLKMSTKGAFLESMNRASQKVEMIIRMMAETGIKELVLRVHEILLKYQDKPRIVKLRGKYIPINPREWKERTDLTVKVGLGTGTEEERRQKLLMMNDLAQGLIPIGLVGPQQAFNLFSDIGETLGYQNSSKYAMDPDSPEYQQLLMAQQQAAQQPQPNPLADIEQIKGQYNLQIAQLREQYNADLEEMKMRVDSINQEEDRRSREAIEAAKLEISAMLKGLREDLGKPGIGAGLQDETIL